MRSRYYTEPPSRNGWVELVSADVFLLDVHMPEVNGLDLIPAISELVPDARVVIITGCADKATAIKALRLGAFDFMEKPVQAELLYHSIRSAVEARTKDRNLEELINELEQSRSDLTARKKQLEHMNTRLTEANNALSVLAHGMGMEREEMERGIALKIAARIMPAIEELRRDSGLAKHAMELDMLAKTLEDLTSGFTTDSEVASALSPCELRVASLVKHGMRTEEVATQLGISAGTVKAHRKSIRRKLKIDKAQYNLKNYLSSSRDITRKR
jgi:FixJ family two-component response regulator